MNGDLVLYELAGGVATLTLNRPERRNAWTIALADALSDALQRCEDDGRVRAVVVTGAGVAFSVGADLTSGDLRNPGADSGTPVVDRARRWPHELSKPVIAALNGDAVGAGISFALLCDLRVVAADAKIGFVFARRGVVAEMAAHWSLPRAVGAAIAADLLLTGRVVRGDEAVDLGICHRALPADRVLVGAQEIASGMARDVAPVSTAISKRLLWEDFSEQFASRLRRETALLEWCVDHGEAAEGVAAFIERREPHWRQDPSRDTPRHLL